MRQGATGLLAAEKPGAARQTTGGLENKSQVLPCTDLPVEGALGNKASNGNGEKLPYFCFQLLFSVGASGVLPFHCGVFRDVLSGLSFHEGLCDPLLSCRKGSVGITATHRGAPAFGTAVLCGSTRSFSDSVCIQLMLMAVCKWWAPLLPAVIYKIARHSQVE